MKKILFLGYVIKPEEAKQLSGVSIAGNKMQWNIIKNLSLDGIEIACITITPLAAYPKDKCIFQKFKMETLFPGVISYKTPYVNIPIIKQITQIINVYRLAKKIVGEQEIDTVLCFNLFPQIGIPMRWLRKKFNNLEGVSILADLPIDDDTNRRGISVLLRRLFDKSTFNNINKCNKFIVLNSQVAKKYLTQKQYIVFDGGVDEEDIEQYNQIVEKKKERNILYCGALTEYNGIFNLLQAIKIIKDKDIFLDIYGGGYLEEIVRKEAACNSQIRYYGKISNEEVMQKQMEAWLLINPRRIHDPISQVTFPSKTFEYMLSGTPVLSTKLNGYGPEYNGKILFSDGDTGEELAKAIDKIAKMDTVVLQEYAQRAREFVIKERKWSVQVKRIEPLL